MTSSKVQFYENPHFDINASYVCMETLWKATMSEPAIRFDLKVQQILTQLIVAIGESGMTRIFLAEKLGWSIEDLQEFLHQSDDIDLKKLFCIASAIGLDFDIVYDEK